MPILSPEGGSWGRREGQNRGQVAEGSALAAEGTGLALGGQEGYPEHQLGEGRIRG